MSDEGHEWTRKWVSEVALLRSGYGGAIGTRYAHVGPADFKLDGAGNLRLVLTLSDGTEIDIALHLAGTFSAVSQDMLPEETENAEDEVQVVNGTGTPEDPW